MTQEDKNDLIKGVQMWTKMLKRIEGNTFHHRQMKQNAMNSINALNKEIDTGIPHCTCHLKEYKDCPTINS